jgi:hypothetical protein
MMACMFLLTGKNKIFALGLLCIFVFAYLALARETNEFKQIIVHSKRNCGIKKLLFF